MINNDGSDASMLKVTDDYNKKILLIGKLELHIQSAIESLYRDHAQGHDTQAWCNGCQALQTLKETLKLISEKP
jgi:hypothetical protein